VPPLFGRKPSDPHHLRFMQPRALGRKASDEFTVPLCRIHHQALHRAVDERAWWQQAGIDPVQVARQFWNETRGTKEEKSVARPAPSPQSDSPEQIVTMVSPIVAAPTVPSGGFDGRFGVWR